MKTIVYSMLILFFTQSAYAEYEIYMDRGFAKVDEIISSATNEDGSHSVIAKDNGKTRTYDNVKEVKEATKKPKPDYLKYPVAKKPKRSIYRSWQENAFAYNKNRVSYNYVTEDYENRYSFNNDWWMKDTYEITPFHNYEVTGYNSGSYTETITPVIYNPYYDPYMSERIQRHYSDYLFDTYHIGTDEHGCYYEPISYEEPKLGFNF